MDIFFTYFNAFWVGGAICMLAQLLMAVPGKNQDDACKSHGFDCVLRCCYQCV